MTNDDKKPHWKDRLVPLTKASQTTGGPPGWDEKKVVAELERKDREWKATASAWDRFRERMNLPPPARGKLVPWDERQREAQERERLVHEFQELRMEFEPPVPPDARDGYSPWGPSDPKDRLYEHKKKALRGLAAGPE